jgi:DNA gyrase/topoisomerase IV subunit A
MSITLIKNQNTQQNQQQNPQPNPQPNPPPSNPPSQVPGGDVDAFRTRVTNQIFDGYCDEKSRADLIRQATNDCGISPEKATVILDMELESRCCVNEKKLLTELEAMLKQFTDKDKKLDPKEREDAMQYVCKARSGYSKGLAYDIAERYIVNFCRANSVKVKTGLFKWAIP